MALVESIITAVCLSGFLIGFIALGSITLGVIRKVILSDSEYFLVSAATGLVISEVLLFLVQATHHFKLGALSFVFLLVGALIWERKLVYTRLFRLLRSILPPSRLSRSILTGTALAACVEFLVAMAPLNGSDAMHYHFTVQKIILEQGFRPIFSNSHSFLSGQHHLLIFLGLSLGSEHLALGFIFLGGILTAASLAFLVSRWSSYNIAALFVLLFLLTPVVFWQISASGAPDIYMAFLVCVTVIVLTDDGHTSSWQQFAVAGLLVGGIAGSKYTGCIFALIVLIAVVAEFRSFRYGLIFVLASLISGCWPYLRNLMWTGNPFFPFLSEQLSRGTVSAYALRDLANDTGVGTSRHLSQLIPFVFLASMRIESLGFWDFFGPTVIAIAPLALTMFKNSRSWRVPLLIWIGSSIGVFFSSGLLRFLLPIYPIALSFAAAGIHATLQNKWTASRNIGFAIVLSMIVGGAGGLAMYAQNPFLAAVGLRDKTKYLEQSSQDYQVVEAVNRLLGGRDGGGKALVFIRHTYYLNVPYLNGDPTSSLEANPDKLKTVEDWKVFLDKKEIAYVVRSPNYPPAIAAPLAEMEKAGDLMPFRQLEVENLRGKRIDQQRTTIQVVILKVKR